MDNVDGTLVCVIYIAMFLLSCVRGVHSYSSIDILLHLWTNHRDVTQVFTPNYTEGEYYYTQSRTNCNGMYYRAIFHTCLCADFRLSKV